MPSESGMWSRRDSWPPTQVRLKPTVPSKDNPLPSLDDIDSDPLTYFLTPAPDMDDDEDGDMMDYDAGIEDSSRPPRETVRSVSPSTLDGLRKPGLLLLRPVSPDTGSDITADDEDDFYDEDEDDGEDYVRGKDSLLDVFSDRHHQPVRPKSPAFGRSSNDGAHLSSPAQFRGRARAHGPSRNAVLLRRRTGQIWREPSPDVWSISEETEEDMLSDLGSTGVGVKAGAGAGEESKQQQSKKKKKRSSKKVRFVLPAQ